MALSKDEVIQMAKKFLDQVRRKYDVRDAYLLVLLPRVRPQTTVMWTWRLSSGTPPDWKKPSLTNRI